MDLQETKEAFFEVFYKIFDDNIYNEFSNNTIIKYFINLQEFKEIFAKISWEEFNCFESSLDEKANIIYEDLTNGVAQKLDKILSNDEKEAIESFMKDDEYYRIIAPNGRLEMSVKQLKYFLSKAQELSEKTKKNKIKTKHT